MSKLPNNSSSASLILTVLLPYQHRTLILFVTSLAAQIKPQSINVYLDGVHSLHVSNGYNNPLTPGLQLKQTLCGIDRNNFAAPNKKCQLPLIFSAKFIPSWTSTLTTILSTITCDHFLLLRAGEFMLCNKEHFDPSCNLALGDFTSHQSPRQSALLDGTHKTVEYWPTTPGGDSLCLTHTIQSAQPAQWNLTLLFNRAALMRPRSGRSSC